MDQGRSTGAQQPDGLRERILSRSDSTGSRDALTATGEIEIKDEAGKDKKTFGRTPDGTGRCQSQVFSSIVCPRPKKKKICRLRFARALCDEDMPFPVLVRFLANPLQRVL